MRKLLALTLVSASVLPGCVPFGCGGYSGGSDKVYQRGTDMLIVCGNGGYSATLASGALEGQYEDGTGTLGTTGAVDFTLTENPDGSMVGLGDGTWQEVTLDQTALDHADVECTDLEMRSWWTPSVTEASLPVETAFTRPIAEYPTIAACTAAQASGAFPQTRSCTDQLVLCPGGRLTITSDDVTSTGSYTDSAGALTVTPDDVSVEPLLGNFRTDGTFTTASGIWTLSTTNDTLCN